MNGLLNTLNQFGPVRLIIIMGVTIGVTLALMTMSFRIGSADKTLLYSGLELKEAQEISARLDQMGVSYSIGAGGSTILVPRKKVDTVRMALAGENLPSSGSMGYEIFDKASAMGQTSFAQNMAQLRALQGELERTITSLNGVSAARVLLVMPKRRLFERDAQQAKASVVIRLQSNIIGVTQTQAIRQLVASAVPGLKAGAVTVADEAGRVLARQDEEGHEGVASAGQRSMVEMMLSRKITSMLVPITGPDGVQVQISADLNLDRVTERSTIYDPDNRVVISSDSSEESSDETEAKTSAAVSVGANVPNKDDSSGSNGGKSNAISSRTNEILNYGNSKTERTIVRSSGAIKRLSVAVVVDGILAKDDAGVEIYNPRTPAQMSQIEGLVKTAIGFDAARGDTVTVSNVRFSRPAPLGDVAPPGMFAFSKDDIMRAIELLILAVVSIAMMIFIVRPLLSGIVAGGAVGGMPLLANAGGTPALTGPDGAAAPPIPSGGQGSGVQGALPPPQQSSELEDTIDVAKIQGQVKASSVNKVAEIVDSHPEESISILRTWLHEA
ncbi:MAG: flagellar M-ring protein FliF [Robiginitomaculum sp.]|nr:MAG: flagellar M-ring protein FliF [Robiginitomaculum sp.]